MFVKTENNIMLDSKIIKDARTEDVENEIYEGSIQGRVILTTVDGKEYNFVTFPDGIGVPCDVLLTIKDIIDGRQCHGTFTSYDAEVMAQNIDEGDYENIDYEKNFYDSLYENAAFFMSL